MKSYRSVRALDYVSLQIEPGQIVSLLGPNGAGKTTMLRCLAGIAAPDKGGVYLDEREFRRDQMDLRRRLQLLPDFPFHFWEQSVMRNACYPTFTPQPTCPPSRCCPLRRQRLGHSKTRSRAFKPIISSTNPFCQSRPTWSRVRMPNTGSRQDPTRTSHRASGRRPSKRLSDPDNFWQRLLGINVAGSKACCGVGSMLVKERCLNLYFLMD